MSPLPLDSPRLYINRDTSWLAFNRRVLEEAEDERNPLLERVKFLAITANNLDEFFEIRVAALLQQIEDGNVAPGADGLGPAQVIELLKGQIHAFVQAQYRCWNQQLRARLGESGIYVVPLAELDNGSREYLEDYSRRELDPLLTPVTVDPAHPFPRVVNKALCLGLLLRRRRRSSATYMGVMTVPRTLPRLIRLPGTEGEQTFVFLADLVAAHASTIYRGYEVISTAAFRITRNSNLYLQEEESRSLLDSVRTELHNRRRGDAVRMEIDADANPEITERLRETFALDEWQVFRNDGPVSLARVRHIAEIASRPDLKFKPFTSREPRLSEKSENIFDELRQRDILLHHPFDSYNPVVSFIETAATDPNVMSIKQTLYRTSDVSPIVDALVQAAGSRKEVTVVVEVKARFDEATNIRWARHLEDAGVQVFHGLVGLKTHCKIALLVRRDGDGIARRYVHLGTGNYNPTTATQYSDVSWLTADEEVASAANAVFNYLTAYAEQPDYRPLLVAPLDLAQETLTLIAREGEHARAGRPARIIAKMNGLLDPTIIQELYRASQGGVEIDLFVRGICALRPGVRGISSRIRVRSIVGRFLEHSRIFYFANGGQYEIYSGSADWMPRNMYERVEVVWPVSDPLLRNRMRDEILGAYLADVCKTRLLRADGTYVRAERWRSPTAFNAQEFLVRRAEGRASLEELQVGLRPASKRRKLAAEIL